MSLIRETDDPAVPAMVVLALLLVGLAAGAFSCATKRAARVPVVPPTHTHVYIDAALADDDEICYAEAVMAHCAPVSAVKWFLRHLVAAEEEGVCSADSDFPKSSSSRSSWR